MNNSYVPIFIIVHNHFETLKTTVHSYITQIKTPFKIIFHDVCSTYKPTLDYLNDMKQQGFTVYRSEINHHHTVLMSVKEYMTKNKHLIYYVITDPDIKLYNVNKDILEYYIYLLNTYNVKSVGPMLKIDDIPDYYPRKKNVIDTHYKQFWSKTPIKVKYNRNEYEIIKCPTDTTFQLSSIKNPPESFPHQNSIRCLHPYSAQHLDWYIDPNNLTPCQNITWKQLHKFLIGQILIGKDMTCVEIKYKKYLNRIKNINSIF